MKFLRSLFFVAVLFASQLAAQSPTSGSLESDLNRLLEKDKTAGEMGSIPTTFDKLPFERTVDAETYLCGAGDVISLTLTMPLNAQYFLPISAEGSLIVPRLGVVALAGKNLKQAERDLLAMLLTKYPNVKGTVTLFKPRAIYVTISGEVEEPGVYTLTAATPVSVALNLANAKSEQASRLSSSFQPAPSKDAGYRSKISKELFGEEQRERRSTRKIYVRRNDGSIEVADLVRYYATREERFNPMLREGDEVVVPMRSSNDPTIGIYGAVRKPGEYEFVTGDNVATLLKFGFGLNPDMKPSDAEIIRRPKDGNDQSIKVNITAIENDQTLLEAGDRLIIHGSTTRSVSGKIGVKGFVKSPGVYPIRPGETKLSDVIKMAGGFSADAYPPLAEMYRHQTGVDGTYIDLDREYSRNLHLSLLTLEDTVSYRLESRLREGMVSVDFTKLFVDNDANADVPLFDGDVIIVPQNTMSVEVVGMVAAGGYMPWVKGAHLKYYIERAKGYLEDASTGRVRVIKGNTRAWLDPDDTTIEPGDIIWVPRKPQIRAASSTEILGVLASIVAAVAGIASLAVAVLRR